MILDAGCGNGKYMKYRKELLFTGMDTCCELLVHAKENSGVDAFQGNGLYIPCKQGIYDGVISIAVLHHLSTEELRKQFINELVRVMQPGGKALVSVWALEQENKTVFQKWKDIGNGNGDYLIPWHNMEDGIIYQRYYHLFHKNEMEELFRQIDGIEIVSIGYEKSNWFVEYIKKGV